MRVRDAVGVVKRRKWSALAFLVIALGGGFASLSLISPIYKASAQIMLHLGQEDVFMPVLPSSSSEVRTPLTTANLEHRANSEIRIIQSDPLTSLLVARVGPDRLYPGIDQPRSRLWSPRGIMQRASALYKRFNAHYFPQSAGLSVQDHAVQAFRQSLAVAPIKDSTVIDVTMFHGDPDTAAAAVNELVRLYLAERGKVFQHQTDAVFQSQLDKLATELKDADQQLTDFRAKNKVIDVDRERELTLARLSEVNTNIQNENVRIGELKKTITSLKEQLGPNMSITAVPMSRRIRDDLLRAESTLPGHINAFNDWKVTHDQLTAQADQLMAVRSQSEQLQQRVKVMEDSRKLYLQKIEEINVQKSMAAQYSGDVSVINWATPDRHAVSPKFGLALGGILAMAVLGSLALAFVLDYADDSLRDESDVLAATEMRVIGWVGTEKTG